MPDLTPTAFDWWVAEVRRLTDRCQRMFEAAILAGADPAKLLESLNTPTGDAPHE